MHHPILKPRRTLLAHAVACLGLALHMQAALAQTASFDIPAQPLAPALGQLARQAGLQLVFSPALAQGKQAPQIVGSQDVRQALEALLRGSGLQGRVEGGILTVQALPATSPQTLPEVRVTAQLEPENALGPVRGYVALRSLSASKTDTPLLETARAISVVTDAQMRDRKIQTVEDAVAYTAGVQIAPSGLDPRFDQIFVRGFDTTTDADYRDGLRQPNSSWLSYFRTEPYGLERLEVVKGPNSVLFGQISPGGMVNRVSKRPTKDTLREVELQLGTHAHKQAQFDLAGSLGDSGPAADWQYRLVGLVRKADTGVVGVNSDNQYLAPSLTWAPSAQTSVTLLAHWQDYATAGSPRPFQLASGELTHFWAGDIAFDGLQQTQSALGYEARHQLNDTLLLRQNLRYGRVKTSNQYLSADPLDADGDTIPRSATGLYERMRALTVDTALEARFATGGLRHQVVAGLDHMAVDSQVAYWYGAAPSISLSNPNYYQSIAQPDTALAQQDIAARQTGLYLQDQLAWDDWRLSLGLRRDRATQTQKDLLASSQTAQTDRATTGSVGLLYRLSSEIAPYASVATSFLPKFGTNVDGDAYLPTKGKQLELGLKYQPTDGHGLYTASVFNLVQQNLLTRDLANPVNQIQTGEVRSRGLELEANLRLDKHLDLVASYTYQDMEVTRNNDGNVGKRPVSIPRHLAAVWGKYVFPAGLLQGWDVGLGARWTGSSAADAANTLRNQGYAIVDARIGFDLRQILPGATLALNASNLANQQYLACQDGYCYRGRGRTVIGSLNYRW
jgi:iron complex outermembrane receptor protein